MKLAPGSEHELVKSAQHQLKEAGYAVEATGAYDQQTKKAIAEFQSAKDLTADANLDEDTLAELEVDVEDANEDLPSLEFERERFRYLLTKNPNYFGNLPDADYEAVEPMEANTSYEELTCVGYEPSSERLEAVVHVKREYGYDGDICTDGSPEYVRFYVDWGNDGNWEDVGMASFRAYDIPGEKPLEYGVSLNLDPEEEFCTVENLPEVRAILSWNQPPPANTPNFVPVWGNVLDARIQIDPLELILLPDLFDDLSFELSEPLLEGIDLSEPVEFEATSLTLPELAETYDQTSVPPKRFGFTHLTTAIEKPSLGGDLGTFTPLEPLLEFDFDIGDILDDLIEESGNTYYEELNCVGLTHDGLNAVLNLKRPNGFSGDLCTEGSQEFVAFWEWDPSVAQWDHLGTTSVNVHDIQSMPGDGLQYAAFLPATLSHRRKPCRDGPSTVRIRATLSWETPPPPSDPYWTPTWGNSMETTVHVPPGPAIEGTGAYLETVGAMRPCDIDKATGMATGTSTLEGFEASESPFGGRVEVTGIVPNPPDVLDGEAPLKYRLLVRPLGGPGGPGTWQPVRDTFDVTVTEMVGSGLPVQYDITQNPDADGFYTYREDFPHGGDWRFVAGRTLVKWNTGGKSGKWELKLEFKAPGEDPVPAVAPTCADGSSRGTVVLLLDNTGPDASLEITHVEPAGGTKTAANECGKIPRGSGGTLTFPTVGDTLYGTYEVTDEHFGHLSLDVRPGHEAHGAAMDPSARHYPTVPTTGESGTWKLDTDPMDSCGFIARIRARDRTVVNSDHIGWRDGDSAGFCLEAPAETDGGTASETTEAFVMAEADTPAEESTIAITDHQFDAPGDDHENLNEEYVTFENTGDSAVDLTGWRIEDDFGHEYTFPEECSLDAGDAVTVRSGTGEDTETDLHWGRGEALWDNTGDSVFLYDPDGALVLKESY